MTVHNTSPKRLVRLLCSTMLGVTALSSCTALVRIPGGRVDVSDEGVFVNFLGAVVDVTDDRVQIKAPGVRVDVQGDIDHNCDY